MNNVTNNSPSSASESSPSALSLHADVGLQLGTLDLQVDFAVAAGEIVAVLGPNGSGKTTLLRALAGLIPITQGRVRLGTEIFDDPQAHHRLTPQQRDVGVVFQEPLLFPHMSALENVAFGLRARGWHRGDANRQAADWLDRVELGAQSTAKPSALSGGQAQRVAIARALAIEPSLVLLDEPLSALDIATRRSVRALLRQHLEEFAGPVVMITHEPLEAITLADRLIIIEHGRVVQDDTASMVARRPRSSWAARLVGLNHYQAEADGTTLRLDSGATLTTAEAAHHRGPVMVTIHPRAVALHTTRPSGSARNCWAATVDAIDITHDQVRVHLEGQVPVVAHITAAALAELALVEGRQVWVAVKATEVESWPI